MVVEEIQRAQLDVPTDREMTKVRTQIEAGTVRILASNARLAAHLGETWALTGDWLSSPLGLPALPEVQPGYEPGVYFLPRRLALASLTLAHFGINRFNPDRYGIELMDTILGGSGFTGRITERVRTEDGLAYSVGTAFPTSTCDVSVFPATAQTKNGNVPHAAAAILGKMRRMQQQPVSQDKLDLAKQALMSSFVFRLSSRFEIMVEFMTLEFDGYPADDLDSLLDRYRGVTVIDIQRVAREYLRPDAITILISGDPAKFESAMQTFRPMHRLTVDSPGCEVPPHSAPGNGLCTTRDGNLSVAVVVSTHRSMRLCLQHTLGLHTGDHT